VYFKLLFFLTQQKRYIKDGTTGTMTHTKEEEKNLTG